MQSHSKPKGKTPAKYILCGACALFVTAQIYADTVYRCGDAYSPLTSCANGTASEVKPTHELQPHGIGSAPIAAQDAQAAQALEKQRRLAERQAATTAPVYITPPMAPTTPASHPMTTPHRGKYARRPPSPYFTAVDPASRHPKKSTAQTVPAHTP